MLFNDYSFISQKMIDWLFPKREFTVSWKISSYRIVSKYKCFFYRSDIEVAESDVFRLQSDLDAARSAVVSPNGSITPSFCVTDRLAADHGCIGPLGKAFRCCF